MFLDSSVDQTVTVAGEAIDFAQGEAIHTENSFKYHPDEFRAMAARAGFSCECYWTDANDWFAVYLLTVDA